ncbi:Os08g0395400, partial [Oryza sativa Japonica Group]
PLLIRRVSRRKKDQRHRSGERGTRARLHSAGSEHCGSDLSHWISRSYV